MSKKLKNTLIAFVAMVLVTALCVGCGFAVAGALKSSESEVTYRDSYADTVGNASFEEAREKYGLTKSMSHGAILHAWMWSFNTIADHMAEIAAAGYTSIQTEPMSHIKTDPFKGKQFAQNWYYVYQPTNTKIGNFVVGTEDDLKNMCAKAHEYGVRVIVDVVANHFTSDWDAIEDDWKDKSLFHARTNCAGTNGDGINYSNRWQVTQCHLLGLWDINTQSQTAADRMKEYVTRAVADGVDGFRFDAAKHVELPDEFDEHSVYWETVLNNGAQYQYGEVLQGDNGLDYKAYADMFTKASSDGGGATASNVGSMIQTSIGSEDLSVDSLLAETEDVGDYQQVTWVESHDNYANASKQTTSMSEYDITMGWAIIAARKAGAPLYFNRPADSGGDKPQFAETTYLGDAGDDAWKSPTVVAVNHFRNAMDGKDEYLANCGSDSCLMIQRYESNGKDDDGVVVVNMGDAEELDGQSTKLDDGTYIDAIGGGALVVSGGKIKSAHVGAKSVAVFYKY